MFKTRIRELREQAGFNSQQSFADTFGVAQSTVGNWEAGKREPNYETTKRLAAFFHVSIDYLLGCDNLDQTIWTNEPISILFSMYSITVKQFSEISGLNYDLVDHLSTVATPLHEKCGKNPLYDSISDEQYKRINEFFHVNLTVRNAKGQCELPLFPNREVVDKLRYHGKHIQTAQERARAKAEEYYRQLLLEEEQKETTKLYIAARDGSRIETEVDEEITLPDESYDIPK